MTINWGALGIVAAASLVVAALVGLSAREPDPADEALVIDRDRSGLSRDAGTVSAVICLLGATAIVLYGLYILTF